MSEETKNETKEKPIDVIRRLETAYVASANKLAALKKEMFTVQEETYQKHIELANAKEQLLLSIIKANEREPKVDTEAKAETKE